MCEGGQKEKINTEQYQNNGLLLPSNMWHPPPKKKFKPLLKKKNKLNLDVNGI